MTNHAPARYSRRRLLVEPLAIMPLDQYSWQQQVKALETTSCRRAEPADA